MNHTTQCRLAGLATTIALALVAAGTAAADPPGNGATGSVGTVQVGPVSATPAADVATDTATAAAPAPAAVTGSGGNQARGSTGSVQAGGEIGRAAGRRR